MSDETCANCGGTRMVCERHPTHPWPSATDDGCDLIDCYAAGMPCRCTVTSPDDPIWSNQRRSVGGGPLLHLTWRELARLNAEDASKQRGFVGLLMDLDRCEHGRHEGDDCSGCKGPSLGNPLVPTIDGRPVLGYTMDRRPIVYPSRRNASDPAESWTPYVTEPPERARFVAGGMEY